MWFKSLASKAFWALLATRAAAQTFQNPVLWEDLADLDIFRVDDAYYYSASTMHYSPGAPILRSYDLVSWDYIGHSVPVLDWGDKYSLQGGRAYIKGIWASTMRYRASNKTWYWLGCIEFSKTYVYTASSPTGPWSRKATINTCYYDAGMLIDDNDTIYVAYGNTQLSVAQLSADGTTQVKAQQVFQTPSNIGTLEGSRFYRRGQYYYIFVTKPANGQYILRATNPFGPYTVQQVLLNMGSPISGGGVPHQGGLVSTPAGAWYYMAFVDAYPGGRVPALAPISWVNDWPQIQTVNGAWGKNYNYPLTPRPGKPHTGTETFTSALSHEWEWNHNPDTSKYSTGSTGLTLNTVTVTNDLYAARNTLTHRILGPTSSGTIVLNYSSMKDGDRAGLAILRHQSAWVGVQNNGGSFRVSFWSGLNMNSDWTTNNVGSEKAGAAISGGTVYLRSYVNINPGSGRTATFFYSQDGRSFTQLGSLTLDSNWQFFMGYRYAIFNHATKSLGGSIRVSSFTVDAPGKTTGAAEVIVSQGPISSATSMAPSSTSKPPATTSAATGGTAPKYGQCGGQGWTGPTVCEAGSTCTFSNDWYSQCL